MSDSTTPTQGALVVITGANSGVGFQVAKTFSAAGYSLLLLDLNTDAIEAEALPNSLCKQVNITDLAAYTAAIEEAEAAFGPVDCLINNAGILYMDTLAEQKPDHWQRMFDVNVMGTMNGIKSVIDTMKKNRRGTIFNMGSLSGMKPINGQIAYGGTKSAISGISEGLRMELSEHNVRVTVVAPGAIQTNLLSLTEKSEYVDGQNDWAESIGGILVPEDMANTLLWVYQQPQHICLREIVVAATRQEI